MPRPKLVPVAAEEVRLGSALPYPLLDALGTLLLAPGDVLHTEQQASALQAIELYTVADWCLIAPQLRDAARLSREDAAYSRMPMDFAALQLPPGNLLYLRRLDMASPALIPARLQAWQDGLDLPLEIVPDHATTQALQQGEIVEIRLLADKHHVVSFNSVVRMAPQDCECGMALAYPEQVTVRQLRRSLRVGVSFPIRLRRANGSESFDGYMVNLGTEGCQIEMPQWIADKGDTLVLNLVPDEADVRCLPQVVQGVVRNLHLLGGDLPLVQLGLQFSGLEETARLEIECYIFQALSEA